MVILCVHSSLLADSGFIARGLLYLLTNGLFTFIAVIWVPYIVYIYIFYISTSTTGDSYAFPPIFEIDGKFMGIVQFCSIPD